MSAALPEDTTVETVAGRFHVLSWGDPGSPVLLLLHGFNQTAHSWDEVAPELAKSFRVVAFDQRGHGDSLRAPGHYGRQTMVDDVGHVATALGIDRFVLVGMSMGAAHAVSYCAQQPESVTALVVVDYAPEIDSGGADKIKLMLMRSWPSLDDAVREVKMFNPRRSEANIRERLGHSLRQTRDGSWVWKVDLAFVAEGRFSEGAEPMWKNVGAVRCPALLLRGGDSDILSAEMAQRMREVLPRGEGVTIAGAGHSVAGDQPAAFCEAVVPFLEQHALGS